MKRSTMKHLVLLTVVTFLAAASLSAQPASIKTENGYLHIFNGDPLSFTLDISGKSVAAKQAAGNPAFDVDGHLIQVLVVMRKEFDPDKKAKGRQILLDHQTWELDYLKGIFEQPLKAETTDVKIGEGSGLFWSFARPKFAVEYDRDCFLTYGLGDDIVGLSMPLRKDEKLSDAQNRLVAVLNTIKISKTPFDIRKMADEIKRGATLQGR